MLRTFEPRIFNRVINRVHLPFLRLERADTRRKVSVKRLKQKLLTTAEAQKLK